MGLSQITAKLERHWGGDRNVAEAAWASTRDTAVQKVRSDEDVRRVVTSLVDLGHDTPKEATWLDYSVTCPIFVERQMDKYRMSVQYQDIEVTWQEGAFGRWGISQNELSGRYRTLPDRPYRCPEDISWILARADGYGDHPGDATMGQIRYDLDAQLERQYTLYDSRLTLLKSAEKRGVITNAEYKRAREVLRGLLGTSYLTQMRIVLNLNALEHVLNQRLAADAQLESRVVALHMYREAQRAEVAPTALASMAQKHGWEGLALNIEAEMEVDK